MCYAAAVNYLGVISVTEKKPSKAGAVELDEQELDDVHGAGYRAHRTVLKIPDLFGGNDDPPPPPPPPPKKKLS